MANYEFLTEAGLIVPDFSDTLNEVKAEFQAVPGWQDIDLSPESPAGALVIAESLRRQALAKSLAKLGNQLNPDYAEGVFLDSLSEFAGVTRRQEEFSEIPKALLIGEPNFTIPQGVIATDGEHNWELAEAVTLGPNGQGHGVFVCTVPGPIQCLAGALDSIVSSMLEWESVKNLTAAIAGRLMESDAELKERRKRELALRGKESREAIIASVSALDGVRSVVLRENYRGTPLTVDGITMPPHSIFVCVDGGDKVEVATAIHRNKSVGVQYYDDFLPGSLGMTHQTVEDVHTGQQYDVSFFQARVYSRYVKVDLEEAAPDMDEIIKQEVAAYFNTLAIGDAIYPTKIAMHLMNKYPELAVTGVWTKSSLAVGWRTDVESGFIWGVFRANEVVVEAPNGN